MHSHARLTSLAFRAIRGKGKRTKIPSAGCGAAMERFRNVRIGIAVIDGSNNQLVLAVVKSIRMIH
jgi:hypothetical protein